MSDIETWAKAFLAMPDLPAWLQAFAALVALGISVWASLMVGAAQRRKDRLQAHGIAVAIYPELLKLETTIKNIRDRLRQLRASAGILVGQSVAASVQQLGQIEIPTMLDRNIDRLFMLDEPAGPSCLQLVSALLQCNALVDEITSRIVMMNADQWKQAVEHLEDHFTLLDGVVMKCKHEVQPIHDAVGG